MIKNIFTFFKKEKEQYPDRNIIKLSVPTPNETRLLFDGFIVVENRNSEMDIRVSEKGMEKLSKCSKPNDPIKLLKKISKKEPLSIIPEKYDEPVCSLPVEGAYRVLVNTCLIRYTQLFLNENRK